MKKLVIFFFLLRVASVLPVRADQTTWDAGRDLVANEKPDGGTQETMDPNATVPQWSYGYRQGITGTALTLFTPDQHGNALGGVTGEEGYEGASTAVGANTTDHDIIYSFCCGPLGPIAPGEMALGVNSDNRSAVVRWTAPAAGTYTYHAEWHDIDPNGGDGAAGYVVVNGEQRFGQAWANGLNNGATTDGTATLAAGGTIDFLLNPNGEVSYDTTRVTFTVVSGGTPPPSCVNPPGGLVSRSSAEGNARDSVGTNDGTARNNTTFVPGEVGQAFQLGENNYVSIPDSASLHLSSLTVEGWINLDVINPGHSQSIFNKAVGGTGSDSIAFAYYQNGLYATTTDANGAYVVLTYPWQPSPGSWHHVAYTFDGASHALYVDGLQVATGANTHVPAYDAHPALIGGDYYSDLNSSVIDFFLGKIDELSLYNRALTAGEVQSIFHAGAQGKCLPTPPPVPPAHGGLSDTIFTVNESDMATTPPADSILRFRAVQTGTPADLLVRVQSSTNYNAANPAAASWDYLADGLSGLMVYAPQVTGYILGSTNYPAVNGVSFRAVSTAPGYPSSYSNVVGPFNLQSSLARLAAPILLVSTNGENNALRFGVKETTLPSGLTVHIQTSSTPVDQASWTDAPIGTGSDAGLMTADPSDARQFNLGTDDYPVGDGIYFRAYASAGSGYVGSPSIPYGPFKIVSDPPATVHIQINGVETGRNDLDNGYLLPLSSSFTMGATATSGRYLKYGITLLYDGNVLRTSPDGASSVQFDYNTNIPGDHVVEAFAIDDLGVTGAAAPVHVRILPAAPGRAFVRTADGDWNDSSQWIDSQGEHGVPGASDFAILGTFSATITQPVTVNAMSMNGGTLAGTQPLTVTGFCTIADGTISGKLTIPPGSTGLLLNDSDIHLSGLLTNNGRLHLHGKGGIGGVHSTSRPGLGGPDAALAFDLFGSIRSAGETFWGWITGGRNGSKAQPAPRPAVHAPEVRKIAAAHIELPAAVVKTAPAPVLAMIVSDGAGVVSHDGGGLTDAASGNALAQAAANLVPPSSLIGNDGAGFATGGSKLVAAGAGNLIGNDGAGLVAAGAGNIVAGNTTRNPAQAGNAPATEGTDPADGIFLTGGELNLDRITVDGDVTLDQGVLSGSGIIRGNLTNTGGFIAPGHSAGAIAIRGSFTQGADGTLVLENGGPAPAQFDRLLIAGNAALGGHLIVRTIDGYTPDVADTFNPLAYGSVTGAFASITANATLTAHADGLLAQNNPAIANPAPGRPANISTRLRILRDDRVLIAGFIVQGAPGTTKKVLIRGLGPSLGNFGLNDVLADPLLELHQPDGTTVTNDNWADAPNRDQLPPGFAPGNPQEAIILADLAPGTYTVIERGADDGIGLGLAEIYDIDANPAVALANISTRGFVDTGENVIIGGFIVAGSEPAEMLVRAIGPTLTTFGVPGALADPVLELHDANGGTISNDNWRETQESDIVATTIPPQDDREPAIRATLVPGNYTAIVRGKDGATGVALVEAYKVR